MIKDSGSENRIFTYDAINCQVKTLKAAEDSNNDVTVCVKRNQKILLNDCCNQRLPCSEYEEPVVKKRNRTESRKVTVSEDMIISDKKMGRHPGNCEIGKIQRSIGHRKEAAEKD